MISSDECLVYLGGMAHSIPGVREECARRNLPCEPIPTEEHKAALAAAVLHTLFEFPLKQSDLGPYLGFVRQEPVDLRSLLGLEEPKIVETVKAAAAPKPEPKEEELDFFL